MQSSIMNIGWIALSVVLASTGCRSTDSPGTLTADGRATPVLLFNGTGTSDEDVAALRQVLSGGHFAYSTINSSQLNRMGEADLGGYRLLLVPGGNFEQIGNHLSASASATLRNAVWHGMNYLGICAGAFFAGNSPYNGLNLTAGTRFGFYAAEMRGIRKTVVPITGPGGQSLDQYWEDGPQLTGWGAVVDRYPDGTPAVVEGAFGSGWVILTGIHPEAPESWRRGLDFRTPTDVDHAYAATLIRAALEGEVLPHD